MDSSVRYIHHRIPPLFDSKEEPCAEGWRLERKQDVFNCLMNEESIKRFLIFFYSANLLLLLVPPLLPRTGIA